MTAFIAKTEFGRFRVSVNDVYKIDIQTRERVVSGKIITIGGKNSCVAIQTESASDTAHLLNVKRTNGGCELNGKEIRGDLTIKMMCLAFTILKRHVPEIKHIKLEDKSDIPCERHDKSVVGISLALYQIMFYGETWYERHFKAQLVNTLLRNAYNDAKRNLENAPAMDFDFANDKLNLILRPFLQESSSWRDFFSHIHKLENRCEVIFPWYKKAIQRIFNDINFERQSWIIDVDDISSCLSTQYTELAGGGRRFTFKRMYGGEKNTLATWADFSAEELRNYPYDWLADEVERVLEKN
jgi:hypothetical protein